MFHIFFKVTKRGYGLDTQTGPMEKQIKAGQRVEVEKSSSAAVFSSFQWGGTRAAHRGMGRGGVGKNEGLDQYQDRLKEKT
jgi:hypothetical protein